MHPYDNDSYATILNIGSYSSSIFFKVRCLRGIFKNLFPDAKSSAAELPPPEYCSCGRGLIILPFSRAPPAGVFRCVVPTDSILAKPRNHCDSLLHQRLNEAGVGEIAIHYYPQCPLPNYVPTAIRVAAVILLRVSVPVTA